jgi:3-hydroxyacyl-[acyl-carrier-protein] dehydratase
MRYLLIDHITEYRPDELIRGIKNVAMSEDFLEFHFPKNPIMPGVMLLEALVQLSGWLQAVSSDFSSWMLVTKIIKSNFYSFALPGDQVELEVQRTHDENPDLNLYRGTGTVNGKKKIVAEFEGEIIPIDEIEDAEEQRRFFKLLTRDVKL